MTTGGGGDMTVDALVIGAGAAGLFCAAQAGSRGRRVLVIDRAAKPAEKIRISGGGRCNFTNIHTEPSRFISGNPHFVKSALARYSPVEFLNLLKRHDIAWREKTLGQLFCDGRSELIIKMLFDELNASNVEVRLGVKVSEISKSGEKFRVETSHGTICAARLIIATGGLSIPKMGATGFAYDVARQFGHAIIPPRAGLAPFVFSGAKRKEFAALSGISCPVRAVVGEAAFEEAMLFTHRGLSGPAILQASSYWREGEPVKIDLFAGADGVQQFKIAKEISPKKTLLRALEERFPKRLVAYLAEKNLILSQQGGSRLADLPHAALEEVANALSDWRVYPSGTEGWRTAEVTVGGVDTRDLSSKTMESRLVPGLYFIGECVDVTGWLGGYNFQWAWSSAWVAAQAI